MRAGCSRTSRKLTAEASRPQPVDEKQDIFYDNAATFLGLTAADLARHHR
jgi:predicted TIM-barrel fold metal-dependent hydrolase